MNLTPNSIGDISMTTPLKLSIFALFIGLSSPSFSQPKPVKFDVNKDIDVVRVYEQVVKDGYGTPFIYQKLATAYYFKSDYNLAVLWFQKLFATGKNIDPDLAIKYRQALKAVAVEKPIKTSA